MQIDSVTNFLGNTTSQFETDIYKVSIVNYYHRVSEDWHYHERVHISGILKGGNLESRKHNDIQVLPGKIIPYREGEVHRNRHTAFPSKNLNVELETIFFDDDYHFSNFRTDHHSYLNLIKIYHELLLNDGYSNESIDQLLKSLFLKVSSTKRPPWITSLKTLLNDRWNEFISLEELAQELQLHPISISKYFGQHTGNTLADYMRKLKVNKSIDLLLNTSSSIAETAFVCGFSDQSHMTRVFKHYVGFTPRALRSI